MSSLTLVVAWKILLFITGRTNINKLKCCCFSCKLLFYDLFIIIYVLFCSYVNSLNAFMLVFLKSSDYFQ